MLARFTLSPPVHSRQTPAKAKSGVRPQFESAGAAKLWGHPSDNVTVDYEDQVT